MQKRFKRSAGHFFYWAPLSLKRTKDDNNNWKQGLIEVCSLLWVRSGNKAHPQPYMFC
jgi:hypothetical protein